MKVLLFIGSVFTIAVGIASEGTLYTVQNEGRYLFIYGKRVV